MVDRLRVQQSRIPIGRTEKGEFVYVEDSWVRSFFNPGFERMGGDLAPSNSELQTQIDELSESIVDSSETIEAMEEDIDALQLGQADNEVLIDAIPSYHAHIAALNQKIEALSISEAFV
jgi:hypothetical protein